MFKNAHLDWNLKILIVWLCGSIERKDFHKSSSPREIFDFLVASNPGESNICSWSDFDFSLSCFFDLISTSTCSDHDGIENKYFFYVKVVPMRKIFIVIICKIYPIF